MVNETLRPLVQANAGPVLGVASADGDRWLGIPYAAPPIGALRFRAPKPPIPWADPLDASRFGPIAPQKPVPMFGITAQTPQSEDCLTLNVFRPAGADGPLPVMVWIHGGAYAFGASSQPAYDGRHLTTVGDVILVTVNYRLGAFGYLDLSAFSTDERPFDRNIALRDQLTALEWVRDNIAAFGGDPDNVTLFGQSAGGGAVTTLMTVPQAKGLFHRAIAQSSPATSSYGPERTERIARRFLELADLTEDRVGELASMPTEQLLEHSMKLYDDIPLSTPGTLAYAPMVDGEYVPDYPIRVFERGEQHAIPLVIGNVRDEATLFKFMKSPLVPIDPRVLRGLFAEVKRDHPDVTLPTEPQLLGAYRNRTDLTARLHIAGDFGFRMPALWFARAHARIAPTWLYRFDYATPSMRLLGIGATHATEVPLEFGRITSRGNLTYKLGGQAEARRLGVELTERWTAFARDERPGAGWPTWTEQRRATYVFDRDSRVVDDLDAPLWRAWGVEPLYLS